MMRWFKKVIAVAVLSMSTALAGVGATYGQDKVVRIGYQKYGKLVLLKSKGTLEPRLKALGYDVKWTEFQFGPPLLEAINVGAIDFGNTGETPPVFAQAAGAPIRYVAYEPPAQKGEAILVQKDSPLKSVADLKGKKVAVAKGSNAHYLLVKALEKAGIKYEDITPVYLAPADARAAFETGAVDAWSIWDPYQSAAETTLGAKTLTDATGLVPNTQFYLSSQKFIETEPKVLDTVLDELRGVDAWAQADIHAVAEQLSPSVGLPAPVLEVALKRQSYGIKPIDDQVLVDQQKLADTLYRLKLVPIQVRVSDIARKSGS
ncbi:sulfonate ABC transporter substrate-binding protein [Bradyrhizobium canariense]|uniref:Putative aliphatic sulfonates-binding protein n=1 Tax=Bradyrhizobium canariense TaxID=255045 RepID=A0A1H2AUS8_9BRAD|nr:sulfonate ABC transporter substrate-binding protein [Bradyrhizobium canariense]SDT49572.1 sulfonate transport system substrate-binding protein [Bradyrhizobium canariense]